MRNIEVGQTLYVNISGFLYKEANLKEYTVQKVNTSSVYVFQEGGKHPIRLNKRTLTSDNGVLGHYKAYVKAEDYWDKINRAKERQDLVTNIREKISSLSLVQLKEIETLINQQKSV
ncbi:beta barrel domain-containing protein [Paenibacillus taichungensis]